MKYNQRALLVVGGLVLLLALLFYLTGGNQERINWYEHYRSDSDEPYGTLVINELLPTYFPGETFEILEARFDTLPFGEGNSNYIYIGNQLRLDSLSTKAIMDFVAGGNTAFLAANELSYDLVDQLFTGACDEYIWPGYDWEREPTAKIKVLNPASSDTAGWEVVIRAGD